MSIYIACYFLVGGPNMYVNTLLHCHFCIQIITDHFMLSKIAPLSYHTKNKCTLIIPYRMSLEVFYQTQIIILPCMSFWLFPWQPMLCSILLLFLYFRGLQEVDIISTVKPYGKILTCIYCLCHLLFYCLP